MTKKLLCMILCAALILPTCMVPVSVAGAASYVDYTVGDGFSYLWDFETTDSNFTASNITTAEKNDVSGNTYWELSFEDNTKVPFMNSNSYTSAFGPNKTITIDLQCVSEGVPFLINAGRPSSLDGTYTDYLGINIFGAPDGNWYTYKIEVGDFDGNKSFRTHHDDFVKVYRKPLGAKDEAYTLLNGRNIDSSSMIPAGTVFSSGYDYGYGLGVTAGRGALALGFYSTKFDIDADVEKATKWNVDNFQIRESVAYTGSYTATDADLFVESNEDTETVIMASYDAGEVLKDVKFVELNGSNNKVDLSVTAGAETKIFIWNKLAGGKPILANPIEI